MPRTDLFEQSAPRVEVDQRSRDARLRLECVARLLMERPLPRQSLLRRLMRCFGSRTPSGGQIDGRSMTGVPAGRRTRREHEMAAESDGAAGGFPAAPPAPWPNCSGAARIGPGSSDPGFHAPRPACRLLQSLGTPVRAGRLELLRPLGQPILSPGHRVLDNSRLAELHTIVAAVCDHGARRAAPPQCFPAGSKPAWA